MSLDEFWHGDIRLFGVYQKAYLRDKSYTAWINGSRAFEAHSKAVNNGNRTKKSDPIEQYNEWEDPIPKKKRYIAPEDVEQEFRNSQIEQNSWLRGMMNKQ